MTGCLDFLGNSFYPLRGGVADCLGMVFLQVVKARAKTYESAVGEFFREAIRERRRDQHARR